MSRHRYIRCRLWTYRLLLAVSGQAAFAHRMRIADSGGRDTRLRPLPTSCCHLSILIKAWRRPSQAVRPQASLYKGGRCPAIVLSPVQSSGSSSSHRLTECLG